VACHLGKVIATIPEKVKNLVFINGHVVAEPLGKATGRTQVWV
jgi:hypothetical protein